MEGGGERKRKSPLELDWDKLLRQEDDEDPVLLAKPAAKLAAEKSMTDGGEESSRDDHFRQTSDEELVIEISRMKSSYPSFATNLPDRGEKLLASIKRREEELERRKHQRSIEDARSPCSQQTQLLLESSRDDHFWQTSDEELVIEIGRMKSSYLSFATNLPDRGEKFLASIKRREEELERRKHQKADGRCKKPTRSTDPTFVGVSDVSRPGALSSVPTSLFASCFSSKLDDKIGYRATNALGKKMCALSHCDSKNVRGNGEEEDARGIASGPGGKYKTEVGLEQGVEHFTSAALQMMSICRGLALQGLERGETASQLVHTVRYGAMKAKTAEEKLEKANADLTTAQDEIAKLTEELQQAREDNARARLEAVEAFKGSKEYKLALGSNALESYAQGMKQARAWCRLKVPDLDTSDLAQCPLGTEDLDLTPFAEQEVEIEPGDDAEDASTPELDPFLRSTL